MGKILIYAEGTVNLNLPKLDSPVGEDRLYLGWPDYYNNVVRKNVCSAGVGLINGVQFLGMSITATLYYNKLYMQERWHDYPRHAPQLLFHHTGDVRSEPDWRFDGNWWHLKEPCDGNFIIDVEIIQGAEEDPLTPWIIKGKLTTTTGNEIDLYRESPPPKKYAPQVYTKPFYYADAIVAGCSNHAKPELYNPLYWNQPYPNDTPEFKADMEPLAIFGIEEARPEVFIHNIEYDDGSGISTNIDEPEWKFGDYEEWSAADTGLAFYNPKFNIRDPGGEWEGASEGKEAPVSIKTPTWMKNKIKGGLWLHCPFWGGFSINKKFERPSDFIQPPFTGGVIDMYVDKFGVSWVAWTNNTRTKLYISHKIEADRFSYATIVADVADNAWINSFTGEVGISGDGSRIYVVAGVNDDTGERNIWEWESDSYGYEWSEPRQVSVYYGTVIGEGL